MFGFNKVLRGDREVEIWMKFGWDFGMGRVFWVEERVRVKVFSV